MGRKKGTRSGSADEGMNMTPMIDVVFQMIIFFVTTAQLDQEAFDAKIRLAMSPHGPAVEKKDPRTVTVEMDGKGRVKIAHTYVSIPALKGILKKAVRQYGQTTPVVIRGDGATKHEDIKKAMDACAAAGLWKVKFAALKERAEDAGKK
jgi:biopolymer transport protein ExbD